MSLWHIILIILALCVVGDYILLARCVRDLARMHRRWAR